MFRLARFNLNLENHMKMQTIGSLKDLRRKCLTEVCLVTGKSSPDLRPALVKVALPNGEMTISGMVCREVQAGMTDQEGRKVLSVVKKDVTVAIRENKLGILYMDGTINGDPKEGWMTPDAIVAAKEAERERSVQAISGLDGSRLKNILKRTQDIQKMWAGIKQARQRAQQKRLKRHKRAS